MTATEGSSNRPASADSPDPLHVRWVCEAWRRAALLHAFHETDALARLEDQPISGDAVDLAATVSRRFRAARTASRNFAIRPWSRVEKAQRGRSAEFWLLSCRIFDDESVRADAEVIACAVEVLRLLGLRPNQVKVRISHRSAVRSLLARRGVQPEALDAWFPLLHRAGKMSNDDFISGAIELGMEAKIAVDVLRVLTLSTPFELPTTQLFLSEQAGGRGPEYFKALFAELRAMGIADWCVLNLGIVRSGAHYTGMVFEVHDAAGRGRSIAGGGRSTMQLGSGAVEEVGVDMGDSALVDLLQSAGALPNDVDLAERVGSRIEVLLGATAGTAATAALTSTAAMLRRAGLFTAVTDRAVDGLADLEATVFNDKGARARYTVLLVEHEGDVRARVRSVDRSLTHTDLVSLDRLHAFLTT